MTTKLTGQLAGPGISLRQMSKQVLPMFASVADGRTVRAWNLHLPKCPPLNLEVARASFIFNV